MTAVAGFGANSNEGIYGLYNKFLFLITRTGPDVFGLKYRIRLTVVATGDEYVLPDIEPIGTQSIVNPINILKDVYFKAQNVGGEFGFSLDDSDETDVANFAYGKIKIEVGEFYAALVNDPPTFQGYDTSDSFWFYNGYEDVLRPNVNTSYTNYLEPAWYNTTPIKLPHTILNRYIATDPLAPDFCKLFFPNIIKRSDDSYNIKNVVLSAYDADGVLIITNTVDISAIFSIDGYWTYYGDTAISSGYSEYYFQYADNTTGVILIDTEIITFYPDTQCGKNDRYRLRWVNKYGAFDYLNFNGATEMTDVISNNKTILSDGINYTATTFGEIAPIADPEKIPFGKSVETIYKLNSTFLNEEEQYALRDLQRSPNIIMFDPDNNIIPVIFKDSSYRIEDIKNKLIKVSFNVAVANVGKIQRR